MKSRFTAHGYARTVLLSILAACLIEGFVNADEMHSAFAAGRGDGQEMGTGRVSYGATWLQVPQQASKLAGKLYHIFFE